MLPLPTLLAGPIVRRVDASGCALWIAASEPMEVTAFVYEGTRMATAPGAPVLTSPATALRRFGANLYVGVVRAKADGHTPSTARQKSGQV